MLRGLCLYCYGPGETPAVPKATSPVATMLPGAPCASPRHAHLCPRYELAELLAESMYDPDEQPYWWELPNEPDDQESI